VNYKGLNIHKVRRIKRDELTVCASGLWAGVDSAWEQKKLEARKMLAVGAADSHTSGAPMMMAGDHFIQEDEGLRPENPLFLRTLC